MTKLEFCDDASASESQTGTVSCCESQSEQSCESCTEQDTISQESLSFSLQDTSALCTDYGEVDSGTFLVDDIESSTFQGFALCFSNNDLVPDQRLLLNSSSVSSEQPDLSAIPSSSETTTTALSDNRTVSQNVALPQFSWQPEVGLCGYALEKKGSNTTINTMTSSSNVELSYSPEKEAKHNYESEDGNDNQHESHPTDKGPLLQLGNQLNSSGEGGTLKDPRYVPRPSSVTPGLRNMSKFFRNLPITENDNNEKQEHTKDATKCIPVLQKQDNRKTQKGESVRISNMDKLTTKAAAKNNTTPPLGKFLQRRSRSDLKGSNLSVPSPPASLSGTIALQRSRTEDARVSHRRSSSEDGTNNKKGKIASFLRRTPKLPSFLKPQLSQKSMRVDEDSTKNGKEGVDSSADIANILASLEDSLKEKKPDSKISNKNSGRLAQQSEPLFTQGSGETTSDTSSLFGGMESDSDEEEEDYYSSDEESSCSNESEIADRFFAEPFYSNQQRWTSKTAYRNQRSLLREYEGTSTSDSWDSPSMISSRTELTRCSSVDTAKASNLSCDPSADRARLLEIQAYLWQQQRERERLLNAPPVDYFHNNSVIRVREAACETIDAACEIEVLPKEDLASSVEHVGIPPTAAEF